MPDKADLFGDPSLVPTRAGEQIRVEIADAAAIVEAVEMLPDVRRVRADVTRPRARPDAGTTRVLIVAELDAEADETKARAHIERITQTVLGTRPDLESIILVPTPAAPAPERRRLDLLLGLAILGLGLSAGVAGERYGTLRRVQAARGRRRPR